MVQSSFELFILKVLIWTSIALCRRAAFASSGPSHCSWEGASFSLFLGFLPNIHSSAAASISFAKQDSAAS